MKKLYLACPYSHRAPVVRDARFHAANCVAGALMRQGYIVYSPLSTSHPIAHDAKIDALDLDFWMVQCLAFVEWAEELAVLCIAGWKESTGVSAEIEMAKAQGKHVWFVNENGEQIDER